MLPPVDFMGCVWLLHHHDTCRSRGDINTFSDLISAAGLTEPTNPFSPLDYPKHAVWQFLQPLVEEGLVVRYEEVEIPHAGVESELGLLREWAGWA